MLGAANLDDTGLGLQEANMASPEAFRTADSEDSASLSGGRIPPLGASGRNSILQDANTICKGTTDKGERTRICT